MELSRRSISGRGERDLPVGRGLSPTAFRHVGHEARPTAVAVNVGLLLRALGGDLGWCHFGCAGGEILPDIGDHTGEVRVVVGGAERRHCVLEFFAIGGQHGGRALQQHVEQTRGIAGDNLVADERGLHAGHAAAIGHVASGADLRIDFSAGRVGANGGEILGRCGDGRARAGAWS